MLILTSAQFNVNLEDEQKEAHDTVRDIDQSSLGGGGACMGNLLTNSPASYVCVCVCLVGWLVGWLFVCLLICLFVCLVVCLFVCLFV